MTGFYSVVNGRTQLENAANDQLTGRGDQLFFSRIRDLLTGRQPEGAAVETTINPAAQQAALDGLAGQQGAVVALEPSTGKILALVSTPGFDPNVLASHDTKAAGAAYNQLASAAGNPLRSNATLETYAPGSTFKLVTAAAALESGELHAREHAARTRRALPPADHRDHRQLRRRRVRRRPDHAGRRPAGLVQHRVRAAGHGRRRRRAARRRPSASGSTTRA